MTTDYILTLVLALLSGANFLMLWAIYLEVRRD